MSDLRALPVGTELVGDYRIRRVLGAGGFGITYLAEEPTLARFVTIKEYFPSDVAVRDKIHDAVPRSQNSAEDYNWGLDRFIDEAQALAKFDHPNIVRVYRYFRLNKTGYMVLHFEEGASLKLWLKNLRRAPGQEELDAIVAPLLDALELIHNADFLHRDIAPDNIIIRKSGKPVLIDFGSARGQIAQHSKTISALVKPGYSPYEQYAMTSRNQGPWTDIYSLAATLYFAICGARPIDAPSRIVSDELQSARDAARSSFRPEFLAAIDRALRLNVKERPQSIAQWRQELLALAPAPVVSTIQPPAPNYAAPASGAEHAVAPPAPPAPPPAPIATQVQHPPQAGQTPAADGPPATPPRQPPQATPQIAPQPQAPAPQAPLQPQAATPAPAAAGVTPVRPAPAHPGASAPGSPAAGTPAAGALAAGAPAGDMVKAPAKTKMLTKSAYASATRRGLLNLFSGAKKNAAQNNGPAAPETAAKAAIDAKTEIIAKAAAPKPQANAKHQTEPARAKPVKAQPAKARSHAKAAKAKPSEAKPSAAAMIKAKLKARFSAGEKHDTAPSNASPRDRVPGKAQHATAHASMAGKEQQAAAQPAPPARSQAESKAAAAQVTPTPLKPVKAAPIAARRQAKPSVAKRALPQARKPAALAPPTAAKRKPPRPQRSRARNAWGWRSLLVKLLIGVGVASAAVAMQEKLPRLETRGTGQLSSQRTDINLANRIKAHKGAAQFIAFNAGGTQIVSSGADETIKLWSAVSGDLIRTIELDDGPATAFAVQYGRAVTGHKDGTIALWDLTSGAKVASFKHNDANIWSVTFLEDSGRIASAAHDWSVTIWDERNAGDPVHIFKGHKNAAQAVAFSTGRSYIASGGADKTVKLWNASSMKLVRSYRRLSDFVTSISFSPDGRNLAAASLDGKIKIFSARSRSTRRTLRGHSKRVTAIAYAPNSRYLASASEDGTARLWDTSRGRTVRTFSAYAGSVNALAFSPNGTHLATASNDGVLRIWNVTQLLARKRKRRR